MSTAEEKLAGSLTAHTTKLIPYLPYLLQDLTELGASPPAIESIIKDQITISNETTILDVACGKGAVGIHLAKKFGCRIYGIDLMPAFIEAAQALAKQQGVGALCSFSVDDANSALTMMQGCDIVIMTDVSTIFGCSIETVRKLKAAAKPGGCIVVDDAFVQQAGAAYPTRQQWMDVFERAGVRLAAELVTDPQEMHAQNAKDLENITRRAAELAGRYPEKRALFEKYVRQQSAEGEALEKEFTCVTWLLRC